MENRVDRLTRRFEEKLRLGSSGALTEGEVQLRVVRYRMSAIEDDYMLGQVRQVLNSSGVPTIMYPNYYAFAHELSRMKRCDMSADSLSLEAQITLSKWVARGLIQRVLQDIRWTVFTIPEPTLPSE